jgi:membrane protease YdiL (CAAX protease family)
VTATADGSETAEPAPPDLPGPLDPTRTTPPGTDLPETHRAGTALPVDLPAVAERRVPRLLDLVAAGGLYAGLLLGLVTLVDPDLLARAEAEPRTFLLVQALDDGILTGIALLFGLWRFPGSWEALGFRAVRRRWWVIGAASGVGAAALAWAVTAALDLGGWPPPGHPVDTILERVRTPGDLLMVLLAVTVPVAIGEEVFFRGYAYRLLRGRFGVYAGIGATAFLFALVHGLELNAWVPILPVGLVFGVLVERSGSLAPAIVGHAAVNALAVLVG